MHLNFARLNHARHLSIILLLVSSLIVSRALPATADEPSSDNNEAANLKVISYNVQFLPGPAAIANNRKNPRYRAETIGKKMAEFDIVGLNEVFDDAPRELLLDQMREAWGDDFHVVTGPIPDDNRVNGGLAIATRLPMIESHSTIYTKSSDPKKYGFRADGFAAKGVLHARILRSKDADPDDYVDVFTTHMEARVDEIRLEQYPELAVFIAQHSDVHHPVIVMGDFNTRGEPEYRDDPEAAYHLLIAALEENLPTYKLIDAWPSMYPDKFGGTNEQESSDIGHRIDYVFLANPQQDAVSRMKLINIHINGYLDPKVVALSDHSAVEADLYWSPLKK